MTPHEVFLEARKRGLQIAAAGDKLAVSPKGACPADFADVLRAHKAEILDWLSHPPCPGWQAVPPATLPLNPAAPRPTPHNRERVIGYMLRQTGGVSGPLTALLARRECAYYDGPGRHWDCALHAYAAARDAACWQLNRSERDVLELPGGFEPRRLKHAEGSSAT
jgi:hypothetical protein